MNIYNMDSLMEKVKEQKLLIPVAGNFSPGKNTLINNFLGKEILDTKIKAETVLPNKALLF